MEEIPESLMSMMNANFMTTHGGHKDDRSYFCVDCAGQTLTKAQKEAQHEGHRVFQAMKCSGFYTYKKDDICRLKDLNVLQVCVFNVNNTDVYFPKSRKPKPYNDLKKMTGFCVTCGWNLSKKPGLFCSILCKLTCSQDHKKSVLMEDMTMKDVNNDLGYLVRENKKKKIGKGFKKDEKRCSIKLKFKVGSEIIKKTEKNDEKLQNLISIIVDDGKKLIPRKRSRKGIPRRAPFF